MRAILDDLDGAAPWGELYYPTQDDAGFLAMERTLLEVLESIPDRIGSMIAELRSGTGDETSQRLLDNTEFFFEGIDGSVQPEAARFRSKLESLGSDALTSEDRDFICEIAADLKGKYSSSMMGAAASLIADGRWNGIVIEPILFPEKAEEFERNELLVSALHDVIEGIAGLLDEVPLADLVETWRGGQRVDLYALTPLYSFLGNLGKLMKESTRRALYSGDYHQVRKRERLLNARINELTTLHNLTWAAGGEATLPDGRSPYPLMAQRATELAAILDLDMLRGILGEKTVKDLLFIVTIEKERAKDRGKAGGISAMRQSLPEELHSLIPLLYDEDLQNFLGFLLGSVLKRASLALSREKRPGVPARPAEGVAAGAPGPAAIEPAGALDAAGWDAAAPRPSRPAAEDGELLAPLPDFGPLDELDVPPLEAPALEGLPEAPAERAAAPAVAPARVLEALEGLRQLLEPLLDRTNAHRKSFEMVFRLLTQRKTMPPAMLQSMHPFLYDVMNVLLPELNELDLRQISGSNAAKLFDYCTFLCDRQLTTEEIRDQVPAMMEKVLRLLEGLHAMTLQLMEDLTDRTSV